MTPVAKRIGAFFAVALLLGAWALTIDGFFISPNFLRHADPERAAAVAETHQATWENASLRAADGVTVRGWLFTPDRPNHRAVLLVHAGVGNRREMLARAGWLLDNGYSCLLIDQRGCGVSGGRITWGVKEPDDIARWAVWLRARTGSGAIFGYGLSRGSTTLIQSLALKPPFTALAAEASGSGNIAQPYQFVSDKLGVSERTSRLISWPLIEPSFWWIRAHYGFDMRNAPDGIAAIRGSQTAVLLIHGGNDRGAALSGVERLRDANPQHTDLVVIPGADHDWFSFDHPQTMRLVLAWFAEHSNP
jgi:pimeloyl-ACP methyl ester carboxylesterase